MRALTLVLVLDAAVLLIFGLSLMLAPARTAEAFEVALPMPSAELILGMWGAAMATLGAGYFIAAMDPQRHVVLIQIGIARGLIELGLGTGCLLRGVATWRQAGLGIVAGALVAVAYTVLYPRPRAREAEHGEQTQDDG